MIPQIQSSGNDQNTVKQAEQVEVTQRKSETRENVVMEATNNASAGHFSGTENVLQHSKVESALPEESIL